MTQNYTPLELNQLKEYLLEKFAEKITGTGNKKSDIEINFLSKAVAAFAIHKLSGCSLDVAANSIVDGGGDGGIDALFYDKEAKKLWLVQSKYMTSGYGEPVLGDISKFREGIENLARGNYDAFKHNHMFKTKLHHIKHYLQNDNIKIEGIVAYSGLQSISEDRIRIFENLRTAVCKYDDILNMTVCNLTRLHSLILEELKHKFANIELLLYNPAKYSIDNTSGKAMPEIYYGIVKTKDLADLYNKYGNLLVSANIRDYIGETDVNSEIEKTLLSDIGHFVYLNNGLTAYCSRIVIPFHYQANDNEKKLKMENFTVVNGAQTLGTIAKFYKDNPDKENGFVFIKIISLENAIEQDSLGRRITITTNYQNNVKIENFASIDPQQIRIASHLRQSGIFYHYRETNEKIKPDEQNFTLQEAISALACLEKDKTCKIYTQLAKNRRALLTKDNELYKRIFRADRTAKTIWRAVQVSRIVLDIISSRIKSETGAKKEFFKYSRWLLLSLIFMQLKPEDGNDLRLEENTVHNISQNVDMISELMLESANTIFQTSSDYRSIFTSSEKCSSLRVAMIKSLNKV